MNPNSPVNWFLMWIGFATSFPTNWVLIKTGVTEHGKYRQCGNGQMSRKALSGLIALPVVSKFPSSNHDRIASRCVGHSVLSIENIAVSRWRPFTAMCARSVPS